MSTPFKPPSFQRTGTPFLEKTEETIIPNGGEDPAAQKFRDLWEEAGSRRKNAFPEPANEPEREEQNTPPAPKEKEESSRPKSARNGQFSEIQSPSEEEATYEGITWRIVRPGMAAMLWVKLAAGHLFKAESGALVCMSDTVKLKSKMDGGFFRAVSRKVFSGEKFFFQQFESKGGSGDILLAPSYIGDVDFILIGSGEEYTIQKDGFLASTMGIDISAKVQKISRGLFSGEGFFVLKAVGEGVIFVNGFGSLSRVDIPEGKSYAFDNKHLVAWRSNMKFEVEVPVGNFGTMTSGEILLCRFHGPGSVLIQSRNLDMFSGRIADFLKAELNKGKPKGKAV